MVPKILNGDRCHFQYRIIISHYNDVIMGAMASQITSLTIVYSTVYSGADQRKHQNLVSLAFVRGIHQSPVNSPHKWPVTRSFDVFFDDVIMKHCNLRKQISHFHLGFSNAAVPLTITQLNFWEPLSATKSKEESIEYVSKQVKK